MMLRSSGALGKRAVDCDTVKAPPTMRSRRALGDATGRPLYVFIESRQRSRSAFLGKRKKQSTPNEAKACLMTAVASPEVKSLDSQALMVAGLQRRTALEMCHEFMAKSADLIVGAERAGGILFRFCTRMQRQHQRRSAKTVASNV